MFWKCECLATVAHKNASKWPLPSIVNSFLSYTFFVDHYWYIATFNQRAEHTHTNQSERFWDPPLYQSQWVWRKIIMWIMFMSSRHLVWLQHGIMSPRVPGSNVRIAHQFLLCVLKHCDVHYGSLSRSVRWSTQTSGPSLWYLAV